MAKRGRPFKQGPIVLAAEDIASGKVIETASYISDLPLEDGTFPVVSTPAPKPSKGLPVSYHEHRQAQHRAKHAEAKAVLEFVGILPSPKPVAKPVPANGQRPIAALGKTGLVITVPHKPSRRF